MVNLQDKLIAARFLCTSGHLTAVLLLFATIENNIEVSLTDGASKSDAQTEANSALVFACLCFFLDYCGMIFGNTLFNASVNFMQIFFHAVGSIFLCWVITENWQYTSLWPIIASTSIPTAIVELGIGLNNYVMK
mgnify:CR=1 FL=1